MCGCGDRKQRTNEEREAEEEAFRRLLRELEKEAEAIPVKEDDVFSPVRKTEEVEVDR